jgi:predicted Zn-dependent peptidase
MIDRTIPPGFNALKDIFIPAVESKTLQNGRNLFFLNDPKSRVFKIDLNIKAGSWYAPNYEVVPLTLKMLMEGTKSRSAKQLADSFDGLGSFIELTPGFDHCTVSVYGLTKYFDQNLEILTDLMLNPSFSEDTFKALKDREIQKVKLNLEKSSYLSSVSLRENLFGKGHPYGRRMVPECLEEVTIDDIRTFYNSHFSDFDILLSGNLPTDFFGTLDTHLGSLPVKHVSIDFNPIDLSIDSPQKDVTIRNPKFVQSSIRLGKQLFNRSHTDYLSFMVLNEILGGYFGSRLMKNIREEKGFTYGIYSQLYALNNAGYFSIGTDVNFENEEETMLEIEKEIELLRTQPVNPQELQTVKNYMTGTLAGSISSPFSIMDKFKAVHYQGLDLFFFHEYIRAINDIDSQELQAMAIKHLQSDDFCLVIVGK